MLFCAKQHCLTIAANVLCGCGGLFAASLLFITRPTATYVWFTFLVHNHVSTCNLLVGSCFWLSAMMSRVHFCRFLQSTCRHTLPSLQLGARHCGRQQALHNVFCVVLATFLHILSVNPVRGLFSLQISHCNVDNSVTSSVCANVEHNQISRSRTRCGNALEFNEVIGLLQFSPALHSGSRHTLHVFQLAF